MRHTDELDAVIACEQTLRRRIAERLAEEAGTPVSGGLSEAQVAAADAAIEAWWQAGEEEHDLRAFRPIGPLEELLAEHRGILERIADMRDRRLS
ncbi:hypothetical protein ARD30_01560 [Bosea thiooxidans]|uniref:Uncharacterized protein n=2 Tax=Bosea thiooxidans TaxID=53254 RepID=A0A0Q3L6Y4_9HYPH|nr:hypothetical protein ARD30_01560 [Bosea thiooxidans]SKB96326.1 hypothetical protein SAMN05660750_03263 [Bosea thiooxidans]